jgi:hypothetical protein
VGNPIPANQTAAMWFDPSAFQVPSGAFGSFTRNGLRSARVITADLSLFKNVPIRPARRLQLRIEIFDLFNTQNLAVPSGTTISNPVQPGTGQVTSIVGNPRQIQFGARFVF